MENLSSGWRAGRGAWLVFGFVFATNWASAAGEAQELPPDIEADRFLLEAERQIGNGDSAAALAALDRVVALQAEHDLEIPPVFWFRHAQVAMETGLYEEARASSAIRYLQVAGREGEDYTAALEVLSDAERWLAEGVLRDFAACPLMVEVPPGSFMMGSPASEVGREDREGPQHRVRIDYPFAVGVYEVTFDEWEACVREADAKMWATRVGAEARAP